jgi:hypothetical protein
VKTSKTNKIAAYLCRRVFSRTRREPTLPPQPQSPDAVPAHVLWVELATRITTQPLHYRSGDEETAADSIYKLFQKVRALMEKHPDAKVFNEYGLKLLNECLRPYTARWHGWLTQQETGDGKLRFGSELVRRMFREELRELQPRLLWFQAAFKAISEGAPISERSESTGSARALSPSSGEQANLGASLAAGIGPQVKLRGDFPNALSAKRIDQKEHAFILGRRRNRNPNNEVNDAIGLAFSGGGIRSATVCLGAVQVLAKNGLLAEVDYLSTVSGGGYFGSFLSSYLTPRDPNESVDQSIKKALNANEDGVEAAAVRHLRNNSKYLLHGGLWGKLQVAGLLASGLATNILMILPLPLLAVLLIYWLSLPGFWGHQAFRANAALVPSLDTFIGRILEVFFVAMVFFWLVLIGMRRKTLGKPPGSWQAKFRGFWSAATLVLSISFCVACVLFALPALFRAYAALYAALEALCKHLGDPFSHFLSQEVVVALIGALPFLFAAATAIFRQQWTKNLSVRLLFFSGPLLYVWVILFVGAKLGLTGDRPQWLWWVIGIVTVLLLLWSWLFVDINSGGPHGYYRDRLCECYLAYQGPDQLTWWQAVVRRFWSGRRHPANDPGQPLQSVGARLQLPMTKLTTPGAAPYHLVNTAVNLPASADRELRGRNGDFFLLSPHVCGSPICGYVETSKLIDRDPHIDLGTAMAISGAAAAPNMGWRTLANYRFLLALFNVRLGYWIPNVRQLDQVRTRGVGPRYFFAEITGQINENMRFLNISDGGHIENLGVYELLRRKCKFIICVHGGADLGTARSDLQRLERYASIDLGIKLEYNLTDLQPDAAKICRAYAILIKVVYGPGEIGWMIYLKPVITGAEPQYVLDYRYQNADFPNDGILEQAYDEERFEAYRAVGECAAESLFRPEIVGNTRPGTIRDWFQSLANNLLPDNDAAFPK